MSSAPPSYVVWPTATAVHRTTTIMLLKWKSIAKRLLNCTSTEREKFLRMQNQTLETVEEKHPGRDAERWYSVAVKRASGIFSKRNGIHIRECVGSMLFPTKKYYTTFSKSGTIFVVFCFYILSANWRNQYKYWLLLWTEFLFSKRIIACSPKKIPTKSCKCCVAKGVL